MCTALEKLKEDGKMEGIEEKEKAVIPCNIMLEK